MEKSIDTRRVGIFLAFAFGIAWLTGLVVYLTGGLTNSPKLATGMTLSFVLIATTYMGAPALANVLTRVVTREGWKDVYLRPNLRRGWPFWLAAWFLPAIATIAGAAIFFLLFPAYFDGNFSQIRQSLAGSPSTSAIPISTFIAIQILQAVIISPIVNGVFTFGEEFGWRAYLLQKLLPLGWRKAMLAMGAIWGIWHWPIIFMGYEYGFKYPGTPWLGPLLFIWITFSFGTILAWVALRGGSVWPAVIGHAGINGIAGLAALAVIGQPNPILGPLPVGIIGSLGYAAAAVIFFLIPPVKAADAAEPIRTLG